MSNVLGFITSNGIALSVYVMMAVIFIIGLVQCVFPLYSIRRALRTASSRLEMRTESGAYMYDSPTFLSCKYLDAWWERYIVNLREMRRTNGDCDVLGFINSNTCIQAPTHSQFAELIPGMMTTLGVLGTFIGLVRGLSGLNMQTDDIQILQQSLAKLIEGMNGAFYTSIAGVICAVAFQLIRRLAITRTTDALNAFIMDCQTFVSRPYTQDTKLIQTIYALLIEVRRSNESVQAMLRERKE